TGRCGWITSFLRSIWHHLGGVQAHASAERVEGGAQGWNINYVTFGLPARPVHPSGKERRARKDEGHTTRCWVLRGRAIVTSERSADSRREPPRMSRQAPRSRSTRPELENCTVDASIFIDDFLVKFIRAQGGCLGTRSR